ncbi:MAG TPA: hypothetical protein VGJ59_07645 [Jatrophihabitantaceae bacterium]
MCRPDRQAVYSDRGPPAGYSPGLTGGFPGCDRSRRPRTLRSAGSPQPKEDDISTIHFHRTTTATPEQFLAALTDFGPGRSTLFGNSADAYLKVHAEGSTWADVNEGSGGVWERLRYDWSDPTRIVMMTTDSDVWGGDSGHTYTLTGQPNGTTALDAVVVREGKNLKGRLLGFILGTAGKRVLGKALDKTIKAIEARYNVMQPA